MSTVEEEDDDDSQDEELSTIAASGPDEFTHRLRALREKSARQEKQMAMMLFFVLVLFLGPYLCNAYHSLPLLLM